jgi:hypothetical protein
MADLISAHELLSAPLHRKTRFETREVESRLRKISEAGRAGRMAYLVSDSEAKYFVGVTPKVLRNSAMKAPTVW